MGFFNSLPAKVHLFIVSLGLFVNFLVGVTTGHIQVTVVQNPPIQTNVATTTATTTVKNVAKVAANASTTQKTAIQGHSNVPIQKPAAIKVVTEPTSTPQKPLPQSKDNALVAADAQTVETLNTLTRGALVNVLCTTVTGGSFEPISGSGIFIDSRGIILTNAHVAQYFLLKDYPFVNNIQCVIRTGSPASPKYTAEVMYLPPEWVAANAKELISQHPLGTGENDYAFLRITGPISYSVTLPDTFPTLPMTIESPEVGASVLLAAYPAGLFGGETIQKNLYTSSAVSTIQNLYSFDGLQHVDLVASAGTVVSETGSSGGALVGIGSGKLLGIIATETNGTTTADRQLNAVTIGFIDRSLTKAGFGGITGFLSSDPATQASNFQTNIAPQEISQLTAALKKLSN